MKLPVKFATVQVQQKLPDLARYPHVLVLGKQVHVPEAVDSNQGEVILGFAKMVERMCKFDPICCQKSYLTSFTHQLLLDQVIVFLDAVCI